MGAETISTTAPVPVIGVEACDEAARKVEQQQHENRQAAIDFIESTLGQRLPYESLHKSLRDGIILCKLLNKLRPDTIPRINAKPLPFLQMENINNFLHAARNLGISDAELFQTVDLYEGKGMQQVVITILTIARLIAGIQPAKRGSQDFVFFRDGGTTTTTATTTTPSTSTATKTPTETTTAPTTPKIGSPRTPSKLSVAGRSGSAGSILDNGTAKRVGKGGRSRPASATFRDLEKLAVESSTLGHYQLGNCIGRGQFGAVYKALNMETGRVVAMKRIPLADQGKEGIADLMTEVDLLKSLSHPNIVKYEGFIQNENYLHIILEFVEGGSLLSLMKTFGTLPEKLAVNYVEKMLEGLQYLHERGVVHCDLKCANILTTKDGDIKLSDFGVSKQLGGLDKNTQAVAGTPYWMAPEIIELEGPSTLSDIWSLGCTIIEMLTGKPPYIDLIPMTALFRIVEDDSPELPDDISEELVDFFGRCFQKDLSLRWSAQALLNHEWVRKLHKDPRRAAESAQLLELSTKAIQQNARSTSLHSPAPSSAGVEEG
ncbi:hypothetical protein HK104_004582 [Borealophlyctis nickersoniae]|nr:hypothetical protein HK104_004582 [Borealophlyctis nickersoniae]